MMKLKLQRKREKRARGMAVDTDIIGGWMLPSASVGCWFCLWLVNDDDAGELFHLRLGCHWSALAT